MEQYFVQKIKDFSHKKVIVVGDIMLDQYTFGEVTRISPEAPVPILKKTEDKFVLGGAANVANNLSSLGAKVYMVGIVGNDYKKDIVIELFKERGMKTDGIVVHQSKPTTLKHRLIAGKYQIGRFDEEDTDYLTADYETQILSLLERGLSGADIVILSDYAKGLFSPVLTQQIIKRVVSYNHLIVADFKPKHKNYFKGVDVITPNLLEARAMTHLEDPELMGRQLVKEFDAYVLLTMGEQGMGVFSKQGEYRHFSVTPGKAVDVSGAGDTVVAVFALALAASLEIETAARLANKAGELVVQKMGVGTITQQELTNSIILQADKVD